MTANTADSSFIISIHALLAECDVNYLVQYIGIKISIHALLAECDIRNADEWQPELLISIHALLAECDKSLPFITHLLPYFNPRTPCGVRRESKSKKRLWTAISIHALLAECDAGGTAAFVTYPDISIHALLAECDKGGASSITSNFKFQSTHSLRSATVIAFERCEKPESISIHALLAECDGENALHLFGGLKISIHALLAECDDFRFL